MPTHRSKKRRSPKRRRQILFARLVFAVCCVLLAALLGLAWHWHSRPKRRKPSGARTARVLWHGWGRKAALKSWI